jgi:hypothetical protein
LSFLFLSDKSCVAAAAGACCTKNTAVVVPRSLFQAAPTELLAAFEQCWQTFLTFRCLLARNRAQQNGGGAGKTAAKLGPLQL